MSPSDKNIELMRYDKRAEKLLMQDYRNLLTWLESEAEYLRSSYLCYEEKINDLIHPNDKVLEIGSGTGVHTYSLIKTGAHIFATDISSKSLQVLENKFKDIEEDKLKTLVADMEKLPFENISFDVVTSAGSLSFGKAKRVDKEIMRILKPGGIFICIDSLNNNPIYRLNRYIHYLMGNRSKSTLINMPTYKRIQKLKEIYSKTEVKYFGSISYLMPFFRLIFDSRKAKYISDAADKLIQVKKSAFKFVFVAKV